MGRSIHEWMGLTEKEYAEWLKNEELPAKLSQTLKIYNLVL
jgi:hypothetical protein